MTRTLSCLLIENDPEDQEFFMETLYNMFPHIGCYAVSNGEQALHVMLNDELQPDFIFTDLNMPKMGGLEFLQSLKRIESFNHIPVIVYTDDWSDEHIHAAKTLGAVGIYSKTRKSALAEILKKYLIPAHKYIAL